MADRGLAAGDEVGDERAGAAGHGPPQGAVAGVEEELGEGRGADDRGGVRRHRAQAGPELRRLHVAAAGEEVVHHHLQGLAPARVQAQVEAAELGHAADADALVEARHRHLVGLVEHGGHRRACGVDQRHGERVALHRIHRQVQPEAGGERARVAAEGEHVAVGDQGLLDAVGAGDAHALDVAAAAHELAHLGAEAEGDAGRLGHLRQAGGEELAVAGLVVGQAQAAGELAGAMGQRRLGGGEGVAIEQLVGHAALFQHRDVARGGIELGLGAEELQRAAAALLVGDAGVGAQRAQAVAGVLGDAHHAFLVHRVARARAVGEHLRHPAQLEQAAVGADGERGVALEQPLHRLQRNAGRGPGRGVAGRDLAGVGVAGLERGAGLAVDHGDARTALGQIPRGGGADHAAAEYDHVHFASPACIRWNCGSLMRLC